MLPRPDLFVGPPPFPLTALDPLETPDHSETASSLSTNSPLDAPHNAPSAAPAKLPTYAFRHSGWSHNRERIYDALRAVAEPHARLDAFANCGSRCWVLRNREDPDRYKFVTDCCHDRFCIPCNRCHAALITSNLAAHLTDPPYRLITLTIRTDTEPLAAALTRLAKSFKQLRARQAWKERVSGGIAFLEITWNSDTDRWHPHLHIIVQGHYFPRHLLIQTWLDITGDSHVVHIALIRSQRAVASYVTKYVTKPLHSSLFSRPPRLREAILALKGKRAFIAFGLWSRWKLHDHDTDPDWTCLGHINEISTLESISPFLRDQILLAYTNYAGNPELSQITIRSPPCTEDLLP